jgi:ketosteroid isomerase-like protein
MAGQLESILQGIFDAFGGEDPEVLIGHFSEDTQGVDEISREWMRGRKVLETYIRGVVSQVKDVKSEIRDVHEIIMGDVGLVTFWLEQEYTLEGERHHVSAPSSAVLRREDGDWKVVIFHSIPLPD